MNNNEKPTAKTEQRAAIWILVSKPSKEPAVSASKEKLTAENAIAIFKNVKNGPRPVKRVGMI